MSGSDGLTAVGHYLKPIKHNGLTEKITVESNRDVRHTVGTSGILICCHAN